MIIVYHQILYMAFRMVNLSMVVVLVSVFSLKATAQSGCTSVLIGMAPCLSYVSGSSSTPSSSCCSQLASVVRSQPQCLCVLLKGGGASLGVVINQTLALALPAACTVQTPPVSACNNAANGPGMSPVASPTGLSADAGAGSKAFPWCGYGDIMKHLSFFSYLIIVAAYVYSF